ncbi:MAG: hypothetical protein COY40_05955 [Alphaproteobacteria bacterium CG_4_10_14_0_8_um_filter_53_9]|nr:MAG: hypothetical protein COY40_05955 [Alphaproteobacteria bacterium CG_4_10_14_0_8_um_filter_53_9]
MNQGMRELLTGRPPSPLAPVAEGQIVVVSEGRMGHENQSLGLAATLGVEDPEVLTLRPVVSPWLAALLPVSWGYDVAPLAEIKSGIVIGAGWQVSRAIRWLKRKHPSLFTVQLMKPSGGPRDYDVVALPKHDAKGKWGRFHENVVLTVGMLNRVKGALLAREWERWKSRLAHCDEPRLAVLLGGDSRHGKVTPAMFMELADSVLDWAKKHGGSVMMTASRRTPPDVRKALKTKMTDQQTVPVHWWAPGEGERDNPYFAYLAGCDGAVVTVDSMAMLSEVATAGKPLYVWGAEEKKLPTKFRKLIALLRAQHRLATWEGLLTLRPPAQGLMDTVMVGGFVRARYGEAHKASR